MYVSRFKEPSLSRVLEDLIGQEMLVNLSIVKFLLNFSMGNQSINSHISVSTYMPSVLPCLIYT